MDSSDHRQSMDATNFDMSQYTSQQPPTIFGGYNVDGDPITPTLPPGNYFADFDDMGELGDDGDPKRRRIARACDMCRKKKIKCDGKMPKCGHCQNYKTECIFTQVEKKRNPPKGAKYIEGLENRLGRMEALLKMSGLITEEDVGRTDLSTLEKRLAEKAAANKPDSPSLPKVEIIPSAPDSQPEAAAQDTQTSPRVAETTPVSESEKVQKEDVENLSDMMCSLVTTGAGETRYIGSSSAFSIFSNKGIEWVNEKTGDTSFQETITDAVNDEENRLMYWKPEIFGDIFIRRVFKPLPPREEALGLFKDYFENFNCMFPLFHEPTFMHLVDKQYSSDPYEGSGWWASINVALAIAHRIRVMSNVVPQEEDQKAWLYLKNAMGVLPELMLKNQDLLSVQAMLGMVLFLQGTPNPQPSFVLIAAAIRLAHSIGLHKRGAAFNLHPVEAEQRRRVFWIAYLLDKDTCLRTGRPPVQDDDDMNVELPSEDPPDNIGNIPLADGKGKINIFRLMSEFSVISSKVYRGLYSVKAAKQTDGELLSTIGDLDKELEAWKDSIPLEFRPEHEIKATHTPLLLHIVVLHLSYYNCLTTIHRMSVHRGYWTSRLSDFAIKGLNSGPLNPRVFSSAALCVAAARASIHLIKYIPQGDFACVWLIIYFPISALVTLFANILQNPQEPKARADIKLMDLVVNFLSNVVVDESTGSLKRIVTICSEFARIARVVLEKAEKEGSKRKRRIPPEEAMKLANLQQEMNNFQTAQNARAGSFPPNTPGSKGQGGSISGASPSSMFGFTAARAGMPSPNMMNNLNVNQDRQSSAADNQIPATGAQFFNPSSAMPTFNESDFLQQPNPFQQRSQGSSPNMQTQNINGMNGMNGLHGMNGMNGTSMSPPMPTMPSYMDFQNTQQQFMPPPDLWQMPMTFQWDWADFGNVGYPDLQIGDTVDPSMPGMGQKYE